MRVIGLDLSLRATGYADERGSAVIKVGKGIDGPERLAAIRDEIMRRAFTAALPDEPEDGGWEPNGRPLVVLEGYSFGSKGRAVFDVGELGGVIRLALWEQAIPYVEVAPSTLKKFATGKGNAGKDEVLACAIRRWEFEGTDNNAADAHLLRLMGEYQVNFGSPGGRYVGDLPVYALEALGRVEWPQGVIR